MMKIKRVQMVPLSFLLLSLFLLSPGNALAIEFFGLVGSDYNSEPINPWSPGWKAYFAGGCSVPINSRFDAEFLISKRADYNDIDRAHFQTKSGLTSFFGELTINLATRDKLKVYAFGGAGLLHYDQRLIAFNGPGPDDDDVIDQTFNHLGVSAGVGTKLFINEHVAIRPEFRFTFDTAEDFNSEGHPDIGKQFISLSIGIVLSP